MLSQQRQPISVMATDERLSGSAGPPILFDLTGKRIYVAGHTGMVEKAIVRRLGQENSALLTGDRRLLDLTRQQSVERWFSAEKPDVVIVAAAKVGGIAFNSSHPAEFLYDNLAIALNVVHAAYEAGVSKLLFLGSSCIYPRLALQPMREDMLLTGPLEPTNQWYAIVEQTSGRQRINIHGALDLATGQNPDDRLMGSRMASPSVGSPITSCQVDTEFAVIGMKPRPWQSSKFLRDCAAGRRRGDERPQ